MAGTTSIEHYLATHTQLPLEEVAEIYHAGAPWPILYNDLERMAHDDAQATGIPVETAAKALDQLCDIEATQIKVLIQEAEPAVACACFDVPFFDIPEVQALRAHPIIRDWLYYSERVALRVGESDVSIVFAIYLCILQYAWDHPEWARGV
ncbi:MAG: hypothetical protein AAB433_22645 [Nitrospirota bacterium]